MDIIDVDLNELVDAIEAIDDSYDGYEKALKYYKGIVDEVFASATIRRELEETGSRYRFNLAKTPVRVLANRLALTGISVADNEAANQAIEQIRAYNRMQLLEPSLHLNTLKFGDAYLLPWPVYAPGDDGSHSDQVTGVKVVYNSPLCVRALYTDDDDQHPYCVIKSWWEGKSSDRRRRADLYRPDGDSRCTIERYITRQTSEGHHIAEWVAYLDPEQDESEWLIEHPFGLPWFHFRTDSPYGVPEHYDAYGPQDAINKLLITQITTTDSHGFPQRYGLLDPAAVLDEAHDDPDWGDDADADESQSAAGGVQSGERVGPGTMQKLTGFKEVGQFDAADPTVFTTPVDLYVRLMSQVTDTPLYDFDPSREQPSGEARRRAEAPLVARVDNRKLYLGATWGDFWRYTLGLVGIDVPHVDVHWSPSTQIDDADSWTMLKLKMEAGVPREQILIEAGYTAEQAKEWAERVSSSPRSDSGESSNSGGQSSIDMQADLDWGLFGIEGDK